MLDFIAYFLQRVQQLAGVAEVSVDHLVDAGVAESAFSSADFQDGDDAVANVHFFDRIGAEFDLLASLGEDEHAFT